MKQSSIRKLRSGRKVSHLPLFPLFFCTAGRDLLDLAAAEFRSSSPIFPRIFLPVFCSLPKPFYVVLPRSLRSPISECTWTDRLREPKVEPRPLRFSVTNCSTFRPIRGFVLTFIQVPRASGMVEC